MPGSIHNVYRSAAGQAALLFLYLFLVMTSYIAGKVSRDALFLEQFQAIQLPYADIAIAALVGVVIAAYVRLSRLLRMHALLMLSLAGYVITCLAFWWMATRYDFPWLYPVVYVWIGIFGVLATAQVWTLANYVFTTREAKSSFSAIGSGAISGAIAGGYIAKAVAARFGAESLLLVMALALTVSIGLVLLVWRARRLEPASPAGGNDRAERSLAAQLRNLWAVPHLRVIAVLIALSSFATTTASWQFKAIAKQAIPETAALAAFFGEFNFYAAILSLLVQIMLTSRLLKRYGIGPALLLVPVALLTGSAGVILFGTLAAAIALKGADQVFRYSVDKSSMELLYLPVPAGLKIEAKSFIDTVVWRFGDGLAGVGVLVAAGWFHATPRTVGWVTLGAVVLWAAVALAARKTYVASLKDIVRQWRERGQEPAPAALVPAPPPPQATAAVHAVPDSVLDTVPHIVVDALQRQLADASLPLSARIAAVGALARLGTSLAERALEAALFDPDPEIRHHGAAALQSMLRHHPELRPDCANITAALAVEIAHHYRSYQALPELHRMASRFPARLAELRATMEGEAERIFRLLDILYPDGALDGAYAAIRSQVPTVRDSALELLDHTLEPRLRRLLLPLFDESLSVRERARIAARLLGEAGSPRELAHAAFSGGKSWLRRSGSLPACVRRAAPDPAGGWLAAGLRPLPAWASGRLSAVEGD